MGEEIKYQAAIPPSVSGNRGAMRLLGSEPKVVFVVLHWCAARLRGSATKEGYPAGTKVLEAKTYERSQKAFDADAGDVFVDSLAGRIRGYRHPDTVGIGAVHVVISSFSKRKKSA